MTFADTQPEREFIDVAAGVLRDAEGRVLVSRRPTGRHLAGMWEFPGGKIEPDEAPADALARELAEELGIEIGPTRPLVSIRHEYPDRIVRLRLFEAHSFSGEPHGAEGQALRWVPASGLRELRMPDADRPLIPLLALDGHYSISPSPASYGSSQRFIEAWQACLRAGFGLLRLRPAPGECVDAELIEQIDRMTRDHGARWIASGELSQSFGWPAHGIHLDTGQLLRLDRRPLSDERLVLASCHDLEEIRIAESIGADLVTLSPVAETASHPDAAPIGWDDFERVVGYAPLPVMALGGVAPGDWARARAAGAFGVAGIRAFGWEA